MSWAKSSKVSNVGGNLRFQLQFLKTIHEQRKSSSKARLPYALDDMIHPSVCVCPYRVRRLLVLCFRPASLRHKSNAPRDGVARAPLLDAAAQNAVNSSTLSVATWWL